MKLYLLERTDGGGGAYTDEYDSCVVAAPNKKAAMYIHPETLYPIRYNKEKKWWEESREPDIWHRLSYWGGWGGWVTRPEESVKITYLGRAEKDVKQGVICASFNAG